MYPGLRKITKKNIIKEAVVGTPPTLVGAIFNYGRIGSGKTTAMMSLAQKYHDVLNYKIIDLHGGERNEQFYWTLASKDFTYWQKVKKFLRLSNEGPKQYKVNLLYPCFKGMRTKLPQNTPFVNSKVFTIPFKDVTIDDIALVVGTSAATNEYFWREGIEMCKDKNGPAYLDRAFHSLKGTHTAIYKNFVKPLTEARLLSSKRDDYNIDLIDEIKDRETITVVCLDCIPKEFKLFILGWFLRQLSLQLDLGKIHNKNIVMIREAAEFFRATDTSILPDKYKIFRVQLSNHIRYGRKGIHCFLDCQSPAETRGLVDGCLIDITKIKTIENKQFVVNKKIQELKNKFKVLSYSFENATLEINDAKKINTGLKDCYEIEFYGREKVIATEEHRFFDKYNKEVRVAHLVKGDELTFIK